RLLLAGDIVYDNLEMPLFSLRERDAVAANIHIARIVEDHRFLAGCFPGPPVGGSVNPHALLEIAQRRNEREAVGMPVLLAKLDGDFEAAMIERSGGRLPRRPRRSHRPGAGGLHPAQKIR